MSGPHNDKDKELTRLRKENSDKQGKPRQPQFQLFKESLPPMSSSEKQPHLITLGGRICYPRCQATSKQTGNQCRAPASKGKMQCRFHSGKSTGPVTEQGQKRCAAVKTIHGRETRAKRQLRAEKLRELRELEGLLKLKELIV